VANRTDDIAINVDDIVKFDFQHSTSEQRESITVRVKLIHHSTGKVYYYLDMSGLIVPTEDDAEYYLTGDRFYLIFELDSWQLNVTKVYCEGNESVACPFLLEISNLRKVSRS
jgi:hypothetical protein